MWKTCFKYLLVLVSLRCFGATILGSSCVCVCVFVLDLNQNVCGTLSPARPFSHSHFHSQQYVWFARQWHNKRKTATADYGQSTKSTQSMRDCHGNYKIKTIVCTAEQQLQLQEPCVNKRLLLASLRLLLLWLLFRSNAGTNQWMNVNAHRNQLAQRTVDLCNVELQSAIWVFSLTRSPRC